MDDLKKVVLHLAKTEVIDSFSPILSANVNGIKLKLVSKEAKILFFGNLSPFKRDEVASSRTLEFADELSSARKARSLSTS